MSDQPEKLDLTSHNLPADKAAELLRLFPEIRTEGDRIDFDKLRLVLGESVDVGKERYGMTWHGKAECFKVIQAPSAGTLLPAPEESVNFDATENLIIEGDNLEVLKLLQKAYLGKVKMIYIDPPYNTGNDFIYPDNYSESLQTYLEYTGQVDAEGRKFSTNSDTDGRFHSRWLNMMYPRLYLARNLLTDDGLVFISIDDNEQSHLISLCKEVFGEENFVGMITRSTGTPTGGGNNILVNMVDYIVIFSKTDEAGLQGLDFTDDDAAIYDQEDEKGRYLTRSLRRTGGGDRRDDRPTMYYPIKGPDGIDVYPIGPTGYESRWICGHEKYKKLEREGLIEWKQIERDGRRQWWPYQKFYLEGRKKQPSNLWTDVEGNKKATRDMKTLFDGKVFDSPKPIDLISKCIEMGSDEDSMILDFFAGSGTTAHAVLQLNRDNSKRRFILVQLPEPTENVEFPTISEITKERVRRAIKNLNDEGIPLPIHGQQDRGFRVFKLAESNFKAWDASAPKDGEALIQQLELHIDHIRAGRTSADILYEILLKSGFPLTTPIQTLKVSVANGSAVWQVDAADSDESPAGKTFRVYSVAGGAMLICLEKELTLEVIRAMAEKKPQRVICLDLGFAGNDQLKANAVQIFKTKEVVFKTV